MKSGYGYIFYPSSGLKYRRLNVENRSKTGTGHC